MSSRNFRTRFLHNNLAAADGSVVTASSALSTFGVANAFNAFRFKRWIAAGCFIVTASNKTIYINDGTDKTVTLTEGSYTYTTLASHVQTKLNASSSSWTCSYATTGGNAFRFRIGRSAGTAILRYSQTTNAAWSMLGYTGTIDASVGTGTNADEVRCHTSETVTIDYGAAKQTRAFAMIGPAGELFCLPDTATLTLKASNSNTSTAPWGASYDLAWTITPEDDGAWKMLDDEAETDTTYRYWQIEYADQTNPLGPESFEICQIFLGDYITPLSRNLNNGIERELIDPSVFGESENGTLFFRRRTKYWSYAGMAFQYVNGDDRAELERLFSELGRRRRSSSCSTRWCR
jgi:hypothetical protein